MRFGIFQSKQVSISSVLSGFFAFLTKGFVLRELIHSNKGFIKSAGTREVDRIGKPIVMRKSRIQCKCFFVVRNGFLVLAKLSVDTCAGEIGFHKFAVKADGFIQHLDGFIVFGIGSSFNREVIDGAGLFVDLVWVIPLRITEMSRHQDCHYK